MTKRTVHQEYLKKQTAEVAVFAAELRDHGTNKEGTFDSAAANDFMATAINQNNTGVKVPENLQIVLDEMPSGEKGDAARNAVTRAILDGIDIYESQHGCNAPADVIELGLHLAYSTSDAAKRKYKFDSATSDHQDNLGLQPNRAVLAILSTMGDAIPFAHYLPADIGSNKGVLAVMAHQAGNTYGQYAAGGSMDGANSGNSYISASRVHVSLPAVSTGVVTGALTAVQATDETCDSGAATIKLLRGRTLVYVNGVVAAKEVDQAGSGSSAISGTINVAGTDYAIGGSINTDTGVYSLTTTPALGTTVPVAVVRQNSRLRSSLPLLHTNFMLHHGERSLKSPLIQLRKCQMSLALIRMVRAFFLSKISSPMSGITKFCLKRVVWPKTIVLIMTSTGLTKKVKKPVRKFGSTSPLHWERYRSKWLSTPWITALRICMLVNTLPLLGCHCREKYSSLLESLKDQAYSVSVAYSVVLMCITHQKA